MMISDDLLISDAKLVLLIYPGIQVHDAGMQFGVLGTQVLYGLSGSQSDGKSTLNEPHIEILNAVHKPVNIMDNTGPAVLLMNL